jgi:hypothetical protein
VLPEGRKVGACCCIGAFMPLAMKLLQQEAWACRLSIALVGVTSRWSLGERFSCYCSIFIFQREKQKRKQKQLEKITIIGGKMDVKVHFVMII